MEKKNPKLSGLQQSALGTHPAAVDRDDHMLDQCWITADKSGGPRSDNEDMTCPDSTLPKRDRLSCTKVQRYGNPQRKRKHIVWDDRSGPSFVRGFCVMLFRGGEKTYYVRLPAPELKSRYRYVRLGFTDQITCKDARELALQSWTEHRTGQAVTATKKDEAITVAEACDRFLEEYRTKGKGRRVSESAAWKANMRRLKEALPGRTLDSIGAADMQRIADGLTQATARVCKSNWSCLFDHAMAERWIETRANPCQRVTVQACKVTKGKRKKCLSSDQIQDAIKAADGATSPVLGLYVRLLALTGHRPGELLRARWADHGDDAGSVLVQETKKGRPIQLPPVADDRITEILSQLRQLTGESEGLFGTPCDTKSTDKAYRKLAAQWKRQAEKVESLQGIKLSHFRSTAASKAYQEAHAQALAIAAERLQHRDSRVTEGSYIVAA